MLKDRKNGGTLNEAPTGADLVADALDELAGLLPRLQALLPEPVADPTVGTTTHRKAVGSPAPWTPKPAWPAANPPTSGPTA